MSDRIFVHTQVPTPEDCVFKISPSQIANFFDYPVNWYKSEILNESQFHGNTASVLGTAVHYIAEQYALSIINDVPLDTDALKAEIESQLDELSNPDVDIEEVKSLYIDMATELINGYVSRNLPTHVESQLCQPVQDSIYTAGSNDAYDERTGTVVDYKTTGKKPSSIMPFNYKIQALAYAWMLKQSGKPVSRIRLVYVVRPTKTIGIRVIPVTHVITQSDWDLIENTLNLIAESIAFVNNHPETKHLIFKSMQFKES